jgi:hypothetical protein
MTTTTERIANAIKGILEEDRRESRERIAELERDCNQWRACSARQTELIGDLKRQLDEAHKENARLILAHPHHTAPVVEEQGPWVIQDQDPSPSNNMPWAGVKRGTGFPWEDLEDLTPFETRAAAEQQMKATPSRYGSSRVITLTEARAIEAKRG